MRAPIDDLARTQWDRRESQLVDVMTQDAVLFQVGQPLARLVHERLLDWMSSPKCAEIIRYYRQWGIEDVFDRMTRRAHTRGALWLKLSELVDKRNNIAHGDLTTEATQLDVRDYRRAVLRFCRAADPILARHIGRLLRVAPPW